MKQAGSMFEASCRNRNANSRELAGSLNNPEGNIKQALEEASSKLKTILWQGSEAPQREPSRKLKVSLKKAQRKV